MKDETEPRAFSPAVADLFSLDGKRVHDFHRTSAFARAHCGSFYLIITAFALFAYMYVRGQLIDTGDMARTADNIVANEHLFALDHGRRDRHNVQSAMGFILYELFKVVNPRLALLALVFIHRVGHPRGRHRTISSAANHIHAPEYLNAFDAQQRTGAGARADQFWAYGFSVRPDVLWRILPR